MYVNKLPSRRNSGWLRDTEGGAGGGGAPAGDGPGGPLPGGKPEGEGGKGGDEFTPITTKDDFENAIKRRISAVHRQYADYDGLKAAKVEYDALLASSETEHDQAVAKARDEGFNEAMSKSVPSSVKAAFRAEAKGLLSDTQRDALLEDLDLVKYATDDGEPDWEKITKKVQGVAGGGGGSKGGRDFGQGQRQGGGQTQKGEAGAAEANKRFKLQKTG